MPQTVVDNVIIPFLRGSGSSDTPNMRDSGLGDALTPYDECIVVTCAALRRFNPPISIELATNVPVDGPLRDLLDDLGVVNMVVPFTHEPPEGFADNFSATLYYLDVISHVPAQGALLLDPDVLCTNAIGTFATPTPDAVMGFPIEYPVDYQVNGLSRLEAAAIHEALDGATGTPNHYGGEFYFIPGRLAEALSKRLELAWADSLDRFERQMPYLVTEEHFLSFGLRPFDVYAPQFGVKRIWTTLRQRNVSGDEIRYALWHLPSEKGRGFHTLFQFAVDRESWFWVSTSDEFRQRCGAIMGLHSRPPLRFLMESLVGGVDEAVAKLRGLERCP